MKTKIFLIPITAAFCSTLIFYSCSSSSDDDFSTRSTVNLEETNYTDTNSPIISTERREYPGYAPNAQSEVVREKTNSTQLLPNNRTGIGHVYLVKFRYKDPKYKWSLQILENPSNAIISLDPVSNSGRAIVSVDANGGLPSPPVRYTVTVSVDYSAFVNKKAIETLRYEDTLGN